MYVTDYCKQCKYVIAEGNPKFLWLEIGMDVLFTLSVFETKCLQVLYVKRNELVVITRLLAVAAFLIGN